MGFATVLISRRWPSSISSNETLMGRLPEFNGYTIDYRLKQFRRIHPGDCVCRGGEIEFIEFQSAEGETILKQVFDSART